MSRGEGLPGGILIAARRNRYLGQTEVENLHPPIFREKYVFGFQIAVDNPFIVRRR
jgi:hypothetical protein